MCGLRESEGEPKRRREARCRRKNGLIAVRQLANSADLRIPHMLIVDVDVDLAIARGVPSVLRRPEHREVAASDAERPARRADAAHESRRYGVRGGQLAQSHEARLVGSRRVGFDRSILLQEWVVALNDS